MGIKHPPGPWIVCTPSDSTDYLCIEEDSQLVGEASTIAEVNLGGEGISEQIGHGNAHLIAAAPDLLRALKTVLLILSGRFECEHLDFALAAIAKAEGNVR